MISLKQPEATQEPTNQGRKLGPRLLDRWNMFTCTMGDMLAKYSNHIQGSLFSEANISKSVRFPCQTTKHLGPHPIEHHSHRLKPPQLQKKTFKKSGGQPHILARCGTSSLLQTGGPRKNSNDSKDNLYPPSMTIQNTLPSRRVGLRAELPSSHFSIPDG